jgi:hypothetical protein
MLPSAISGHELIIKSRKKCSNNDHIFECTIVFFLEHVGVKSIKRIRSFPRFIFPVLILLLSACGGGSSDSGGGLSLAPGDTIPKDVRSTITQSGSYGLPDVSFLTDIRINCSSANVNAVASSPINPVPFTINCSGGNVGIVDFPPRGGNLQVTFNSGNEMRVQVTDAQSINCRVC